MTVKEMIKQLNQYDEEMEVRIEHLSLTIGGSFSAEPKLIKWGDRVIILSGKRVNQ